MSGSTVHIEFQRVQSWLFSVPRLRAMVGANALLGEMLRIELHDLARSGGGGRWRLRPETNPLARPAPSVEVSDPLASLDDIVVDTEGGIRARDGGHFEAVFAEGAEDFAREATAHVREKLPGLKFSVDVDGKPCRHDAAALASELPPLLSCEWSGGGIASSIIEQGIDRPSVSLDVARRQEAARRSEEGEAQDLATRLIAVTPLKDLKRPQDFADLAAGGYLAVIHADGNNIGQSAPRESTAQAVFFHRNRVLLRHALKVVIDAACKREKEAMAGTSHASKAPLLPLMLGGDDVLVVCRARSALPFVVDLCRALQQAQESPKGHLLTLGIGVVVAKEKMPFHRLHSLAEQLAASAKRKYRGLPKDQRASVVDWAVYTSSWADEVAAIRRRDWIRGAGAERRILSRRPLQALGDGLDRLEGLVSAAEVLADAPRSQLRFLTDQLARGRRLSELAFSELSKEAKRRLSASGVGAVWHQSADNGAWMTSILDLVEVSEIGRLGRRTAGEPGDSEDETPRAKELHDG